MKQSAKASLDMSHGFFTSYSNSWKRILSFLLGKPSHSIIHWKNSTSSPHSSGWFGFFVFLSIKQHLLMWMSSRKKIKSSVFSQILLINPTFLKLLSRLDEYSSSIFSLSRLRLVPSSKWLIPIKKQNEWIHIELSRVYLMVCVTSCLFLKYKIWYPSFVRWPSSPSIFSFCASLEENILPWFPLLWEYISFSHFSWTCVSHIQSSSLFLKVWRPSNRSVHRHDSRYVISISLESFISRWYSSTYEPFSWQPSFLSSHS